MKLTMSRGLKTWCTSSSDDGLEMADFKRACSGAEEGRLNMQREHEHKGGATRQRTHQQAEAIFKFLEDVDELLLRRWSGLGGE